MRGVFFIWCAIIGAALVGCYEWQSAPKPRYDLLFSTDIEDTPYPKSARSGLAVWVQEQKVHITYTADPGRLKQPHLFDDLPYLFVCNAATGELRRLYFALTTPVTVSAQLSTASLTSPELEAFVIDEASTAPNGYTLGRPLFGRVFFGEPHNTRELFDDGLFIHKLKDDAYRHCLKEIESTMNPAVHFIGWVVNHPDFP